MPLTATALSSLTENDFPFIPAMKLNGFDSRIQRLNEAAYVAEAKGKRLQTIWIVVRQGHMIRHKHIRIVNFLVDPDGFYEIDVTLVGINLQKIVAVAANIPKMDVEYFLSRSEVTDNVKDFLPGIYQHLRTVPWQKLRPWYSLSWMETNFLRPSTVPSTRSTP